jgi:hypothetical protein
MRNGITAIIFLLFYAFKTSSEESDVYYIQADVANVREKPAVDASVVARLKIGVSFSAQRVSGEWLYITTINPRNRTDLSVNGWVNLSSCTKQPVNLQFIDQNIKAAKSFSDTLKWCERRVALEPENELYLQALQKGYIASSDTAKAAAIGRKLRKTEPIYFACYENGRILVKGVIDSSNTFRTLEWKQTWNDEKKRWDVDKSDSLSCNVKREAIQLRLALAGLWWYYNGDNMIQFPSPRIFPQESSTVEDFQTGSRGSAFYCDIEGTAVFSINLENSQEWQKGVVFATRPMFQIKEEGLNRRTGLDSVFSFVRDLYGSNNNDSISITGMYYRHLPEYGIFDFTAMVKRGNWELPTLCGLFNRKWEKVWPPDEYSGTDGDRSRIWFRFGPDAHYPAFSVIPFTTMYLPNDFEEHNGNFGTHLVRVSKDGFQSFVMRSEYAGD